MIFLSVVGLKVVQVMRQSFIHKSKSNNLYLYDDKRRLSLLVHPEFEKAHKISIDVDPYYSGKYEYLKKNGFFENPEPVNFTKLEESVVSDNIKNVKQVVFETTDSCNLNCTYCSLGDLYEGFDERIHKKMDIRYAINFLKYVFDHSPPNKNHKLYISFYGGEATINMNFIKKIVEVANKFNIEKGLKLEYSMTTNGTLIDKHIAFLAAHNFSLLISLDGNEENHSYRVFGKNNKNSFQKVIENVDIIQRDYPDYFSNKINFNAVLHDKNSVKDIYNFIYTRYNKIPRISELNMRDIKTDKKEILKKMLHSKRKSEAEFQNEESELSLIAHSNLSLYRELTNFLNFLSINYYMSNILSLFVTEERYLPTSTCTPFSKKIFLTNRNKLLPCERINYKYSMGSANENIEIDIKEITNQYNFFYNHIKRFCQTCYAHRFCGACMFQISNIDKVDSREFVCEYYLDKNSFKNKLNGLFSFLEKYPNDFSQILENIILE